VDSPSLNNYLSVNSNFPEINLTNDETEANGQNLSSNDPHQYLPVQLKLGTDTIDSNYSNGQSLSSSMLNVRI
jgi:hypothetical protein